MFGKRVTLFRLFGFAVHVDPSWLVLAFLVAWTLAAGVFPFYYEGLSQGRYWMMGVAGTAGLFVSIVFHEMTHSLVARRYGLPMKGITLFIFGGVAEMDEEPPSARAEFMMAVSGPLSSIFLSGIFYAVYRAGIGMGWPVSLVGVLGYLSFINFLLAGFNLLPAFPLDGGRVLRAAIWGAKGDLRKATRISSRIGSGFGWALIFLGAWRFVAGDFIGGMWWILIGMFLKGAAASSYRQMLMRQVLSGETVRRFMNEAPVTVPPSLSVERFVEDYVYRHHFKLFPVVEDSRLVGCVGTKSVKELPREEWGRRTVGELAGACTEENSIGPDADAMKALSVMSRRGNSRLLVTDNGRLEGIISLKDMMKFFSLKLDLEEDAARE